MNFWERTRLALYRAWLRLQGIEPGPGDYPPPAQPGEIPTRPNFGDTYNPPTTNVPPEYEVEEEIIIEETPPEYGQSGTIQTPGISGCSQGYYPGRIEGRHIRVSARYYVENPDVDCIRSMLASVGSKPTYTLIICGTPCNDYPGKEGESSICLGFVRFRNNVIQAAYGADTYSAVDFANEILRLDLYSKIECWEEIDSISILDK